MKNNKPILLLVILILSSVLIHAQQKNTGSEVISTRQPDGSIRVSGIKSTVIKDSNGNITTEADLDNFLDANKNYTKGASINMESGIMTIFAKKLYADPSEVLGQVLPTLTYLDINKKEVRLIDQENPFLLCFWDTTCGNCIVEIQILNWLAREFNGLRIVAITTDPYSKIKEFMTANRYTWSNISVITDYKEEYLPMIKSIMHPTTVLVSKSGVIDKIYVGNRMRQMIVDLDSYLTEK